MIQILQFAVALWGTGIDRARAMRAGPRRELGASAIEWAIISAILVTASVLIGGIIFNVVKQKGADLEKCSNTGIGGNC